MGLKISLNNTEMGVGVIPNLVMRPGNHTYKFFCAIPQDQLITLLQAASSHANLTIASNGTSIDSVKIPWLSKPLEALDTLVPINTN